VSQNGLQMGQKLNKKGQMLIEPKDLAEAIGMKYETLRKHISRKKLFRSGKFIDTEFSSNKDYILDQTDGKGLDFSNISSRTTSKLNKSSDFVPIVKSKQVEIKNPAFNEEDSLNRLKKKAELEKIKYDTQIKKKQLDKMNGELIPVELMQTIFTVNIQHIIKEFHREAERIATIFCESLGGGRDKFTQIREELNKCVQRAVDTSKEEAAIEIKQAINEYVSILERRQKK